MTSPKRDLKISSYGIDMNDKNHITTSPRKDLKTSSYSIDMNKRDLKKLTKAQLIRLLPKQEKHRQAEKPSNSAQQMVNNYEDIIQPPEQFRDAYKPIPAPWTKMRKPVPKPCKSVKQMVKEYEDIIIKPPEKFRDGYKPIPKPRTDRPLQMQNARRPPNLIDHHLHHQSIKSRHL